MRNDYRCNDCYNNMKNDRCVTAKTETMKDVSRNLSLIVFKSCPCKHPIFIPMLFVCH